MGRKRSLLRPRLGRLQREAIRRLRQTDIWPADWLIGGNWSTSVRVLEDLRRYGLVRVESIEGRRVYRLNDPRSADDA